MLINMLTLTKIQNPMIRKSTDDIDIRYDKDDAVLNVAATEFLPFNTSISLPRKISVPIAEMKLEIALFEKPPLSIVWQSGRLLAKYLINNYTLTR